MGALLNFIIGDEVQIVVEVVAKGKKIAVVFVVDAQLLELGWVVDWARSTCRQAFGL